MSPWYPASLISAIASLRVMFMAFAGGSGEPLPVWLGGRYLRREEIRRSCANDGNSIGVRHGVFSRETEIVATEANIDPGDSPVSALAHFE